LIRVDLFVVDLGYAPKEELFENEYCWF